MARDAILRVDLRPYAEVLDKFLREAAATTSVEMGPDALVAEWFEPEIERRVRREELAAVPGQVECPGHRYAAKSGDHHFAIATPCPGCKAVV